MSQSPPAWFTRAIDAKTESHYVEVRGARVHYLTWNEQDVSKPGLLFAHGFRAHARWWSFIAPFFLSRYRVAALDFSGMGDSDARAEYSSKDFSEDILGVMRDAQLGRTTLVGHSFGGGRVARTCADHPELIERAVIIDSSIPVDDAVRRPPPMTPRPKKVYATQEAARARFRLIPEQNAAAPYILDYIALHSMQQVAGGWQWKFDENMQVRHDDAEPAVARETLARIKAPVTYMYGDMSAVVSRALAHRIVEQLHFGRGPIAIPQSHHHVMLDQPLALAAALKAVLY